MGLRGPKGCKKPIVIRQTFQCLWSDCGYHWRTRRDTPPARCPGCQRYNWMAGDLHNAQLINQPQVAQEETKAAETPTTNIPGGTA